WLLLSLLLVELVKVEVVKTDEKVAAADDPVDEPFSEPFSEPLSPLPLSKVKVQSFTSCTSGCPSGVIGVKVIVHISVAGPIGLGLALECLPSHKLNSDVRIRVCYRRNCRW